MIIAEISKLSLQLSAKGRIIETVNPSLASVMMRSLKAVYRIRQSRFVYITEVAPAIFEHPKPDSS